MNNTLRKAHDMVHAFDKTPLYMKLNFIKSILIKRNLDLHTKFVYSEFKTIEDYFGLPQFTTEALDNYSHIKYLRQKVVKSVGNGVCGALQLESAVALYAFVRNVKPKLVIETGVASGFSSTVILEAMEKNGTGKLISIDLPNYYNKRGFRDEGGAFDRVYTPKEFGVGWLVTNKLKHRWRLKLGYSKVILPKIKETPDIFLHDSDHSYINMSFELQWAKRARYVLSDDITRNTAWTETICLDRSIKSLAIKTFGIAQIYKN